ncbi:unnamed protein product [Urochloa humidicola]
MGAGLVCHSWLHAAEEPSLWRYLDMSRHNNVVQEKCRSGDKYVLCAMAEKAVDCPGGQLEAFIGEKFVDDDLLNYIGDRAPSLKVLHLIDCLDIHREGFLEAVNKFHLLEELKISLSGYIGYCRATYEDVGKACQNLKILKIIEHHRALLDKLISKRHPNYFDETFGIATMHGLHYLKIICSGLNNEGLTAIIDNCPHLEFLDLCYCPNLYMDDAMRAKCAGVKVSVCPHYYQFLDVENCDTVEDYSAENPYWSDHDHE